MTTPPKRLTAEEEAQALFDAWYVSEAPGDSLVDRIAAALRKRDELYRLAWEECKEARNFRSHLNEFALRLKPDESEHDVLTRQAKGTHDAARRAAGLEDA